jgi:RNA polymerase sigma factor (sigma-70 family)
MRQPGGGGRSAAFERCYAAYYRQIAAYARRRVPERDADDVVAQVFATAWRRFDQVPPAPQDRLWLFAVARNVVGDHDRSSRRRSRLWFRLAQDAVTSATAPDLPDPRREPVLAAMNALRPADREALQLVLWEELSHAEAAAVLGCSANAFELRYRRARYALRSAVVCTGLLPDPEPPGQQVGGAS